MDYEDPLGFTRETAALLNGLGANLSEFKKRNIGLDDLKYLTNEDLIILNVGTNFNHESFKKLCANLRRKRDDLRKPRFVDLQKILSSGCRQLQVIEIYFKYLRQQLTDNKMDYFIEKNQNLRISDALIIASNSVIKEINLLELAIENVQSNKPKPAESHKIKYSLLFGGIGVVTLVYIYHKSVA